MQDQLPTADPTDLTRLRSILEQADPEKQLYPIGMKRIEIGRGAINLLPSVVSDVTAGNRVVLITDATPMLINEDDLKPMVFQLLCRHFETEHKVLGSRETSLHADEKTIEEAIEAIRGADCVVVVGSGTIVDVCKDATFQDQGQPLVVVQTAASVNAFSDNMAVLLKQGVKRTVPSRWPDALLIDLDIISKAPAAMNIAGFGDLMAMWTAPADWYLSNAIGMNPVFHRAPADILRDQGRDLLNSAAALGKTEPKALDLLSRLITLSGISLGIAGSTAPLSGTEHLVSHLIDMSAEQAKVPLALHGAQVGVSTLFVSTAWKLFLEEFDPSSVDLDRLFPDESAMKTMVFDAFNQIDPTGRVAEECWRDYSQKLAAWKNCRTRIELFLKNWGTHRNELSEMVAPPEKLCHALTEAGAPTRFSGLDPQIPEQTSRWALENCHLMRNRFTLADLLFYLGWWNKAFIDRVIAHVESIGGGL